MTGSPTSRQAVLAVLQDVGSDIPELEQEWVNNELALEEVGAAMRIAMECVVANNARLQPETLVGVQAVLKSSEKAGDPNALGIRRWLDEYKSLGSAA